MSKELNLDDILAKHRQPEDYSKPNANSSFDGLLHRLDQDLFSMDTNRRPEKSVTTVSPVLDSLRDEIASLKDISASREPVPVPDRLPEVEIELPSLKDYRFTSRERIARFESETEVTQDVAQNDTNVAQGDANVNVSSQNFTEINETSQNANGFDGNATSAPASTVPANTTQSSSANGDLLDSFTPEAIRRFMQQTDGLFDESGAIKTPEQRAASADPFNLDRLSAPASGFDATHISSATALPPEDIAKTVPLNFSGQDFRDTVAPTQVLAPVALPEFSDLASSASKLDGSHISNAPVAVPGDDGPILPSLRAQPSAPSSPVLVPDDFAASSSAGDTHLVTNNAMALDTSSMQASSSAFAAPTFAPTASQSAPSSTSSFDGTGAGASNTSAGVATPGGSSAGTPPTLGDTQPQLGVSGSSSLAKLSGEAGLEDRAHAPAKKNYIFAASLVVFIIAAIIAAIVFFTSNKPTALQDGADQQASSSTEGNGLVKRQAPLFFTGGKGYVIFVDPDVEISTLKFDANIKSGMFEVRNTTVSKPLSGDVLASGDFAKSNTVTFQSQKLSTIVIVFKDVPSTDKTHVQITGVEVE